MSALTFLGTGPGAPVAERGHSSALLETCGKRFLIDAGEPCSRRLKEIGVPVESLDAVFISHGHSDHTAGLMMLIQGAWLEGRTRPLPIYLPGELVSPLRAWLQAAYLPEKLIGFSIDWQGWETQKILPVKLAEEANVMIFESTHLYGLRKLIEPENENRFLAYGFSIVLPGPCHLVLSADLGVAEDLDGPLRNGCHVLVCELAHFEPEVLFEYLQKKKIGRLYLTHLTARFYGERERIAAVAAEMLPDVEMRILADGERIEL